MLANLTDLGLSDMDLLKDPGPFTQVPENQENKGLDFVNFSVKSSKKYMQSART